MVIREHRNEEKIKALLKRVLTEPRIPIIISERSSNGEGTISSYFTDPSTAPDAGSSQTLEEGESRTLIVRGIDSIDTFEENILNILPDFTFIELLRIEKMLRTSFLSINQLVPHESRILFLTDLATRPKDEIYEFLTYLIEEIPEVEFREYLPILINQLNEMNELERWNPILNKISDLIIMAESLNDRELLNKLVLLIILIKLF